MTDTMDQMSKDHSLIAALTEALVARTQETIVITDGNVDATQGPAIEFVNAAAERRTGFTKDQLIGQPLSRIVLADALPAVLTQLRKIRDTGETTQVELKAKDAKGKEYWIELSTVPIWSPSKTLDHLVRIGRDITGRKQAEQQRETTQRLLASVFGVIDNPLLVADNTAAIIMSNAALSRQLGWGVFDTIGKPLSMLVHESGRPALERLIAAQDSVDQTKQLNLKLLHRKGTPIAGVLHLTVIKQPDQQQYFVVKLEIAADSASAAPVNFEHAVRQVLGKQSGAAPVVAGKLQLVGLEAIRENLGDRWPEVAERSLALAERIIKKHCQAGDVCRRSGDDGFLVFFDRLTESEAQFKARAIGDEIREKLMGEVPEVMEVQVASYAASVVVDAADAAGDEEAIIDALEKRLETERRRVEVKARETAQSGLRSGKAIFQHIQTEQHQPAPILAVRMPKAIRIAVDTLLSFGKNPYGLEAEIFLLTGASERILATMGQNNSDLIVTSVRFTTLSHARDCETWLKVARTLGDAGRRQVVVEVVDLPRDVAQARLMDLATRLSTLFRAVAFELPISDPGFAGRLPDSSRLASIAVRRLADGGGAVGAQATSRLIKALGARRCRLIVKDTSPAQAVALAKAGVTLILMPPDSATKQ